MHDTRLIKAGLFIFLAGLIGFSVIREKSGRVAGASTQVSPRKISGLVIPHHELAAELTYQALDKIKAAQDVRFAVILSPNHFVPKSPTFVSTTKHTEFKIATGAVVRIREKLPDMEIDEGVIKAEHGITIPARQIVSYFPEAVILPIIVSPYYTEEKLNKMAEVLTEILPRETLIVASVDFSHYSTASKAFERNDETIKAISGYDYLTLRQFSDDNLDSPAAMEVLMRTMQKRGTTIWQTWGNSHGSVLTNQPTLQGTSYVVGVFY